MPERTQDLLFRSFLAAQADEVTPGERRAVALAFAVTGAGTTAIAQAHAEPSLAVLAGISSGLAALAVAEPLVCASRRGRRLRTALLSLAIVPLGALIFGLCLAFSACLGWGASAWEAGIFLGVAVPLVAVVGSWPIYGGSAVLVGAIFGAVLRQRRASRRTGEP